MPTRTIEIDGRTWKVFPSGFLTAYEKDEFGLLFVHGEADGREVRVSRYSPRGARSREQSLMELSDDELKRFFAHSQPGSTAPETGYRA
jgi:hypothetical protein